MSNPVGDLVLAAVVRHGARTAFREHERSLSFAEAGARIARLANVLIGVDEGPGRVGVLLRNGIEYAEADLAIAVAGKVRVPVNPRLADEERAYCLAAVSAETLVTEGAELERVAALLPELPALRRVLVVDPLDGALPRPAVPYEAALSAASPQAPIAAAPLDAPAVIRFTSGTTGRPKGAVIAASARLAAMRHSMAEEHLPEPDDAFLHAAPMGHASGDKVLTFFHRGAANAFVPRFDAECFAHDVGALYATGTFLVPTMLRLLVNAGVGRLGLRNLTYGGSPIDADTRAEVLDRLGPVLTQIYGATETPHPVLVLGHHEHLLAETAEATGRAARGVQVRLGEDGELQVRGPNVMSGYWNDPTATAEALPDGWFRSGDLARELPGGWYAVVDRKKDVIITGGLNVYPAEVEAALLRHPGVAEAAVFGLPDPLWGEIVAAAVVPASGRAPTAGELQQHCASLLAGYKKPRHIELRDTLPRTATNKILKRALRDAAIAGKERS